MTISSALSNAMTGLRAAGRTSAVISSNIANAMTPGYGVRSLGLSSSQVGGVMIDGVMRNVNPGLIADMRLADAELQNASDINSALNRIENVLGTPDEPDSLSSRLSDLETTLIQAASRPDAPERLMLITNAARDLATSIVTASEEIQNTRSDADRNIQVQIERLNTSLSNVQEINSKITRTISTGGDPSALYDSRQAIVDEISAIVPVRQIPRDNGQIALYSTGGAILLDGGIAEIEFSAVNQVTPFMSLDNGLLSGITINGYEVRTDNERGALAGGSLSAQFAIRDDIGTSAQSQLDAMARDLVERFQDPGVDPTLGPTDAGLFTDAGAFFDPANETGLSARLSLNALVDDRQGGDPWRLRDGINAATPGDVGNARLIQAMSDALNETRVPSSGEFGVGGFSAINLVSTLTSQIGAQRFQADQVLSFASSQYTELKQQVLAQGVDTDAELQRLLIVEQAYAANARMIEAADEMMQAILRI